ncbi:MAG: glycosyltransferase family 2 protein [Bacteroidetes bacterium]|nr:glycosyltransferase family 2 protein [Bacteroidota bacterium]
MHPLSVVIVCKNEADVIGSTLQSLQGLSDDIVIYDNGSTDGTQELVRRFGVRLYEGSWEGFGKTKGKALTLARHDWVLFLDADEAVDEELKKTLQQWEPESKTVVYEMAFKNFFKDKPLQFGEWGKDFHVRLFNRKTVQWDEAPVHEKLLLPAGAVIKRMKGCILHRTLKSLDDYKRKMDHYAQLGAEKYYRQGKKAGWIKRKLSPFFSFFSNYILKLGFLDGKEGYLSAKITARYTALKYTKLEGMQRKKKELRIS